MPAPNERQAREEADAEAEREKRAREEADAKAEQEKQAKEMEKKAREEAEAKEKRAQMKLQRIAELGELGVDPNYTLTAEDIEKARKAIKYVQGKTNVCVVGRHNAGKSTFVNCIRGIKPGDHGWAPVKETETTKKRKAYEDPLHPNFIWHDTPGAGTLNCKAWGYYETHKLYAYEKVLLVHADDLTETDIQILRLCKHRKQ